MKCANCFSEMKKEELVCASCGKPLHKDCAVQCMSCGKPLCDTCSLANNFKCKECVEEQKIKIDVIRRSHIEEYKQCPYAFYLDVIKGVETQGNKWTETGILLHELFDKYSHIDNIVEVKKDLEDEFLEGFVKLNEDLFSNEYDKKEMLERGLECIRNFVKYQIVAPKPFSTEEKFVIDIGKDIPKVQVTVDRINKLEDGSLEIVDYKTGKVHVGQKLKKDLQPPLYILGVKDKYKTSPQRFKLLFLKEDKERVYDKIDEDKYVCKVNKNEYVISLQETIREVKTIFGRITRGEFSIPQNVSTWQCERMCKFGQGGIKVCEGNLIESWKSS